MKLKTPNTFKELLNITKTALGAKKTAQLTFEKLEQSHIIPQGATSEFMKLLEEMQSKRKLVVKRIKVYQG